MSSKDITSQLSTEDNDETKDLEPQLNVLSKNVDSVLDQRPSFCLSEEQRKLKSFQERKCDVDQAIQWIVKEIKFLKQQDQNLMRQFVKLRSVLNSIKNRPTFDRKISLPEQSPCEDSPTTFFRDESSPGLRRRAQSALEGTAPQDYRISPLSFDDEFGHEENFENFAI